LYILGEGGCLPVNTVEIVMPEGQDEKIGEKTVFPPSWLKKTEVEAFILDALAYLGKDNWDLSVVFCGDAGIRALNRQFRSIDEPTDVLSFTLGEMDGERFLPGDIVVSFEMVEENAGYFHVSVGEELRRLLLHGVLHLNGMDHRGHVAKTPENGEVEPMLQLQEDMLRALVKNEKKGNKWEK
jgi:probable rRNA maturation factor